MEKHMTKEDKETYRMGEDWGGPKYRWAPSGPVSPAPGSTAGAPQSAPRHARCVLEQAARDTGDAIGADIEAQRAANEAYEKAGEALGVDFRLKISSTLLVEIPWSTPRGPPVLSAGPMA